VAVASLLASLRQSIQADALVGLWCVGRLARSSSGRKVGFNPVRMRTCILAHEHIKTRSHTQYMKQALKEAETVELLRRWAKSHNFANEGEAYEAEHLLATQGLLLVALVNADTANPRNFDMLVRVCCHFCTCPCVGSWNSNRAQQTTPARAGSCTPWVPPFVNGIADPDLPDLDGCTPTCMQAT
jgi:hypothetical protein